MLDWKEELPNAPNVEKQQKASGDYHFLNIAQKKNRMNIMTVVMAGTKTEEKIFFNGDF